MSLHGYKRKSQPPPRHVRSYPNFGHSGRGLECLKLTQLGHSGFDGFNSGGLALPGGGGGVARAIATGSLPPPRPSSTLLQEFHLKAAGFSNRDRISDVRIMDLISGVYS